MDIVLVSGGLGNQTFQYIFARYIEETKGVRVLIDDMAFSMSKETIERNKTYKYAANAEEKTDHNGYELEYVFPNMEKPLLLSEYFDSDVWEYMQSVARDSKQGLSVARQLYANGLELSVLFEAVPESDLVNLPCPLYHTPGNAHNSAVTRLPGNVYYYGYWINSGWFERYKKILLKDLSFRPITDSQNKQYERAIKNSLSIGVHIRRGDFVKLNCALPEHSYYKTINELSVLHPSATYFVFSDEPEWCKDNMEQLGLADKEVVFVEGNYDYLNNYIDMQLMTMCKMLVVGGSSFSYLASLLNQTPGFCAFMTRTFPPTDINTELIRARVTERGAFRY